MCYCKQISIEDVEEFLCLTDDILNILMNKSMFYDDEANERFFATSGEYQNAAQASDNFIINNLIKNRWRYIDNGLFNTSAEDLYMGYLQPLQKKILAFYRKGTKQDTFYYADETFNDRYLLKVFTLRVMDLMLWKSGYFGLEKNKKEI